MTVAKGIGIIGLVLAALCPFLSAQSPIEIKPVQESSQAAPPCNNSIQLQKRAELAENRLKDWAVLDFYKNENLRLQTLADADDRVVFMGDSITGFWYLGKFFPRQPYLNRAIAGQVTGQMLLRFRRDVVQLKPKVVVILGGINDLRQSSTPSTVEEIENNLASMSEIAKANGIRVVLASILPVGRKQAPDSVETPEMSRRRIEFGHSITIINTWLKDYAQSKGHTYCDYYSAMANQDDIMKSEFTDDGLHPNGTGYSVMAPIAKRSIESAIVQD
jgi:lysophospholipase L1-like esterase